ncbi:hypothetical protein CLOM_g734 [Closterium sp. NIES-68]|nr:hypothetical protein CLOM_g734 [Closterium sp. NIES-68]GJP77853.1 hypothetical protein CLOP_g8187 [Closterium sp. NIES-67]
MASLSFFHLSRWNPAKSRAGLSPRAPAASRRGRSITAAVESFRLPITAAALTAHRRCDTRLPPAPVVLSPVRPLVCPAAPRASRGRASSARLSSPFTDAPPSLRFTRRVRHELSYPRLLPSTSLPNSSGRASRISSFRRALRSGQARAFLALLAPLLAALGAAFAAVSAALAALPVTLTATSVVTTTFAASAAALSLVLPLLPLVLGAVGTVGVVSVGVLWPLLDRLLCLALLLNFAASVLSLARDSYRLGDARHRSLQDPTLVRIWAAERYEDAYDHGTSGDEYSSSSSRSRVRSSSGEGSRKGEGMVASVREFFLEAGDPRFDWFVAGVVSLIPGVNGAAWLLASWHSSPFLSHGLKRHMAKNAAAYGLTSLASLLVFALGFPSPTSLLLSPFSSLTSFLLSPFSQSAAATAAGSAAAGAVAALGGVSVVGYGSSSAWWVSVVLGAVHLQLERVRAVSMQESREVLRAFGRGLKRTREARRGRIKGMGWWDDQAGGDADEGAGNDGHARSNSSSTGGSWGGDVWMEAEERRRLQQFDAKLVGRPLQQMGTPSSQTQWLGHYG